MDSNLTGHLLMVITWEEVKKYLKEKCLITVAFFVEVVFELIRVTIVLVGLWIFLLIANWLGFENNFYIEMLHQFSFIGFSIIYLMVLVYGIIDFYRIFNKHHEHDSVQLNLDEVGSGKNGV